MDEAKSDLALFAKLSADVQAVRDTGGADPWAASPFRWIVVLPSSPKGAVAAALVRAWATREGLSVLPRVNSGHDLIIDPLKVEVKFSTLWKGGVFKFQQLRDQEYDLVALLGLEPQRVRLWFVPKRELWKPEMPGQHGGRAGTDTKWLTFLAAAPPPWLEAYGGTLSRARASLEEARRSFAG